MPDRIAYKVMSLTELAQLRRDGLFRGTPADIADGYIHLSCRSQLAGTLDRHYRDVAGLALAAVDLARLGDKLRWEASRGGELFPHIHGTLTIDCVLAAGPLIRAADGSLTLPA